MSHFLTRLAKRTLGVMPTVKPLIAPMFADRRLGKADLQPLSSEGQTGRTYSSDSLASAQDALPKNFSASQSRIQRTPESPLEQPEEEKIQKQTQPDSQELGEEKIQKQTQPNSQELEEEKIQKQTQQSPEEDKDTSEDATSGSPQINRKSTDQTPQMSSTTDEEEPTQVNMKSSSEGVIQRRMQASAQFQQPRAASVSRIIPVNPISNRESASRINPPQNPAQLPIRVTTPQPNSMRQIESTPEQKFSNLNRDTLNRSEPKLSAQSSVKPRSQSNSIEPKGESLPTSFTFEQIQPLQPF